jgi:hypothetical protein
LFGAISAIERCNLSTFARDIGNNVHAYWGTVVLYLCNGMDIFPWSASVLENISLIPGWLGINLPLGRQSVTDVTARQRGYRLAGEGDAMLASDDIESTREM